MTLATSMELIPRLEPTYLNFRAESLSLIHI